MESLLKYLINKFAEESYFLRIVLILLLGFIINIQAPNSAFSQEKPPKKIERLKKPKGEKAKSNRRQLRETRFKTRNKKGDKAKKGNITGKNVKRTKSSKPVRSYSPPNPYFGRKNKDEGRRAKPAPFKMQTLTKKGEQSTRKSISGRRIRPTTTPTRSRPRVTSAPNPYFGRKNRGEGRSRVVSAPNPYFGRKNRGEGRSKVVSAPNPYFGRKNRGEGRSKVVSAPDPYFGRRNIKEGQRAKSFRQRGSASVSNKRRISVPKYTGIRSSGVKEGSRAKSFNKSIRGAQSISRRGEVSNKSRRGVAPTISGTVRNRLPKNPFAIANTKRKRQGEKAWKNDITGAKYKTKTSPRPRVTVSAPSPYYGKPFRKENINAKKNRLKPTFTQPRSTERSIKGQFGGVRTSTRRGERSSEKDIAGRKIRTKGSESRRPDYSRSVTSFNPYYGRKSRREVAASNKKQLRNMRSASKRGEQPFSNKIQLGSIRTSGRKGELSTNRDIAGRKLRTRSKKSAIPSYTQAPSFSPYYGRKQMGDKQKIKSRPLYTGGSISGQLRNNKGIPLGGGAISVGRKLRNNKGVPLAPKPPGQGTLAGTKFRGRFNAFALSPGFSGKEGSYKGNLKGAKPLKGGGSLGIRLRNNKGRSLGQGAITTGPILRNNKGFPLAPNPPGKGTLAGTKFKGRFNAFALSPGFSAKGGSYKGNFKGAKPLKGGGSVGIRLRNNKGIALAPFLPGAGTRKGAVFKGRFSQFDIGPDFQNQGSEFKGRYRQFSLSPGFRYQGANASGNLKVRRGNKHQKAGLVLRKSRSLGEYLPGRLRAHKYHTGARISQGNKHQKAGLALRKNRSLLEYIPGTLRAHKYHTGARVSRGNQHQKAGSELLKKRSLFQYIPGSIRAHNYSGSYRFKRYGKGNLHPSSNFTRTKVNPKEEKERFFKFKIWYTRLFKKTDNQPNQKSKDRRPRYDKDESKIWYN